MFRGRRPRCWQATQVFQERILCLVQALVLKCIFAPQGKIYNMDLSGLCCTSFERKYYM